jgi:type I restriction enzyme S subunit
MFYKETNFKETPIGKIPKDWEVVKLSDKAEVVSGFGFPLDYQGKRSGKYPFIKVNDLNLTQKYVITADNFIDDEDLKALRAEVFPPNTIIFPKIGMAIYLNKFRILKTWGTFDNNIAGVIPKEINSEFLFYYFQGKIDLKQLSGRTTAPSIRKTTLESILIPYPSLQEQQKIAEILSTVDEAIQKTNEIIAKTERLKKGLMQELLTKGIGHKEFKDTEIGRIPKEWEVVKLENVVEIWDKYRVPVKEQDRKPGPFPYCGANGIIDYIAGYTHDGEFVLLAEDGGFFGPFENSAYIMRGKFWANNHVHILKAIEGILINEFLMYCLNFMDLTPFLTGSTRPKLTQEDMRKIPLPLPPIQEQQRIAEILTTIDRKLEIERKEKARLERIKQGLMDLLLTGKIRVKVS